MKLLGHTNRYGEQLDLTSARRDQVHDSHSLFFSPIKCFEVTLPIISGSLSFDDIPETSRPLFLTIIIHQIALKEENQWYNYSGNLVAILVESWTKEFFPKCNSLSTQK